MTLLRLKSAPTVLIEDDYVCNTIPLIIELLEQRERNYINLFNYEHSKSEWRYLLTGHSSLTTMCQGEYIPEHFTRYTRDKNIVLIDSVNQMSLRLGWAECFNNLKKLISHPNVEKMILILHKDCLTHSSKMQINLNHICPAIVTYDNKHPCQLSVKLKKGNKVIRSVETLSFDTKKSILKLLPIVKEEKKEEEARTPLPGNLSTFKIEVDQTEKIEKYKLQLPYMSKINEGESKVYYEPDAVDDWDEEDPDEDLDI